MSFPYGLNVSFSSLRLYSFFFLPFFFTFFFYSTDKTLGSICLLICVRVLKLVSVHSKMQRGENRLLSCLFVHYLLCMVKNGIDSHGLYVISAFYCLFLNYFSFKKLGMKAAKSRRFMQ